MTTTSSAWRGWAAPALGLLLAAGAYGAARPPVTPDETRDALAHRFALARVPLDDALPNAGARRTRRPVSPSLEGIAAWISSVGAGAALGDVDGDGLSNDVCLVDPRTDDVWVLPAPDNTPAARRFPAFALPQRPLVDSATMAPMGCLLADVNEDGRTDAVTYYWGRTPIAFLRVGADTSPTAADFRATPLVPGDERWFSNAATLADVDGDGHLDLVVGNYFQDGGRILDAHATGRESMQHSMSRAMNAGRDRVLLWAGAEPAPAPAVRFRDVPGVFSDEVARGWTLALGAQDLDGDLLPEIYFANDFGSDHLLVNHSTPGHPRFALATGRRTLGTPRSKVLGGDSFKGMGVDFGDLNGDGLPDLVVSNIASIYALEESHFAFVNTGEAGALARGVAPFVDRSEPLGLSRSSWAWDVKLVDLDDDGAPEVVQTTGFVRGRTNRWPELHELAMGNDELLADPRAWPRFGEGVELSGHPRNPLWTAGPDGRFVDVAPRLGFGEDAVSRGVAVGDVDGDGDEDLVIANQWGGSTFWRNDCVPNAGGAAGAGRRCGAFLGLHLLLPLAPGHATTTVHDGHPQPGEGRPAVGAEVRVARLARPPLIAQVDGGNGHSGKRAPELLLGLGAALPDEALAVEVRWRDPRGHAHVQTQTLTPGWHTVLLAWPDDGGR